MNKARRVHHQMLDLFQRVRCPVSKKFLWISWTTMRLWLVSLPLYLLVLMFIMILFKIFCRFWLGLIPRPLNFLHNQRALPVILKVQAICHVWKYSKIGRKSWSLSVDEVAELLTKKMQGRCHPLFKKYLRGKRSRINTIRKNYKKNDLSLFLSVIYYKLINVA